MSEAEGMNSGLPRTNSAQHAVRTRVGLELGASELQVPCSNARTLTVEIPTLYFRWCIDFSFRAASKQTNKTRQDKTNKQKTSYLGMASVCMSWSLESFHCRSFLAYSSVFLFVYFFHKWRHIIRKRSIVKSSRLLWQFSLLLLLILRTHLLREDVQFLPRVQSVILECDFESVLHPNVPRNTISCWAGIHLTGRFRAALWLGATVDFIKNWRDFLKIKKGKGANEPKAQITGAYPGFLTMKQA